MEDFLNEPTTEVGKALKKKFGDLQTELHNAKESGIAQSKEIADLTKAMIAQGKEMQEYQKQEKETAIKEFGVQFAEFLGAEKMEERLNQIVNNKTGVIKFETPGGFANSEDADNIKDEVNKAVGPVVRANGVIVGTVPANNDTVMQNVRYRNDQPLINLCSIVNTSSHSYSYTQAEPKEGGYGEVLEGASKPQIDFKWENRYALPFKVAAYQVMTEEAAKDIPRLVSVAQKFLRDKHTLYKADKIYFGAGDGVTAIEGATVAARVFAAGGMALKVDSPNLIDIANAVKTDIFTTPNFTDEAPYMANLFLVNPVDFYVELVAAKDTRGWALFPQAQLFNEVTIGGVTIKPWHKVPAGKIFGADMKMYNLTNWVPYSVQLGWVNDDFIKNQFTMVGESRFHAFIKEHDRQAFVYDDIATIKTAIAKV